MVTTINDLPIELVPVILENIVKPSHLVHICLVNRTFDIFARESLYSKVFIYSWHKNVKTKIVKLFETLASSPHLAKYVQEMSEWFSKADNHRNLGFS
ncbi:hypothetical protein QCA50_014167 [Cerrena zonata]|uniref:F-box domain-containing protein n=1 Tax=Cerrena zonata TaxID=2478898 RepID=A0AAW0FP41_9APHY